MLFHQFLLLVLCVYACYYLLLVSFDKFSGRRLALDGSADVSEFVVAPKIEPVRVVPDVPKYQLEPDPVDERDVGGFDDPSQANAEIASPDFGAHDLGLETISTSGGIPVASVKFMDWFKKAS
ncbi:hypothetical protein [Niabella hirudinis]|uniref:hypothetical protein n=1 Tax=Niabella hirudinis TaxID=1285929 RepID=UPI003EB865F9